jgi:AAA+ ATPase superfamily predicted ATPase
MSEKLIGRIEEKSLLLDTLASTEAELVAVFGRRRVGKTFLVRNAFNSQIVFECTGIHDASLKKQLENFNNTLRAAGYPVHEKRPSDWLEAFQTLIGFLKTINGKKRKVDCTTG